MKQKSLLQKQATFKRGRLNHLEFTQQDPTTGCPRRMSWNRCVVNQKVPWNLALPGCQEKTPGYGLSRKHSGYLGDSCQYFRQEKGENFERIWEIPASLGHIELLLGSITCKHMGLLNSFLTSDFWSDQFGVCVFSLSFWDHKIHMLQISPGSAMISSFGVWIRSIEELIAIKKRRCHTMYHWDIECHHWEHTTSPCLGFEKSLHQSSIMITWIYPPPTNSHIFNVSH